MSDIVLVDLDSVEIVSAIERALLIKDHRGGSQGLCDRRRCI
jgi:hypothetical protein